jgi:2-polyprenyl-3-methyl-5-hydroxy-6-metoxy-1,4-benzoquinol methylase
MLRPDRNPDDYDRFYDEVGAAQLEERYMAIHAYAVARMHLALEWLLPVARAGGRLLDIGCASGYYSVAFARAGGRATGIDISKASIGLARRRAERGLVAKRCEFLHGDMRSLPISEGDYDAVAMIEVLEHVREQTEALEQALRALRPGGLLVVATPHAFDELPRWQRFRYRGALTPEAADVQLERLGTNPFVTESGIEHEPYFHDAFTFEQMRRLLPAEAEIVRLHSLYMPVPGLRLLGRLPRPMRQMIKGIFEGKAMPASTNDERLAEGSGRADEPLPIPPLNAEASLMLKLSKLMWRIPVMRMTSKHHLLVARRREPSTTER